MENASVPFSLALSPRSGKKGRLVGGQKRSVVRPLHGAVRGDKHIEGESCYPQRPGETARCEDHVG